MAKPIEVTTEEFDEKVVNASTPVLVDFWAPWCGPCKMIKPVLEQVATEFEGVLTIAKVDIDEYPDVPRRYGVKSIPTLLLFKDGEAVDRVVGFKPKRKLLEQLSKHVEGLVPAS